MNKLSTYILCLLCLLAFAACKRTPLQEKEKTDLERRILSFSNDSLLEVAGSRYHDSTLLAVKEALKARDFGAKGQMDSSDCCIRKVEAYCRTQAPSRRISNILAYVENIKAVNWIFTTSSMSPLRDSAVVALENSIRYSIEGKTYERVALAYYNIFTIYGDRNEYAKAAQCLHRALFICDSLKIRDRHMYFLYTALGMNAMNMEDYADARSYYALAQKSARHMTVDDRVNLYSNLGSLYVHLNKKETALLYMKAALQEVRQVKVAQEWSYYGILVSYAGTLVDMKTNLPEAGKMLDKALAYYENEQNPDMALFCRTRLLELALIQRNIPLARQYVDRALAEKHGFANVSKGTQAGWFGVMDEYYRRMGDYKQAYEYDKKAAAIQDSISGYAQRQYIANLNLRFRQDTTLLSHRAFIRQQKAEISSLYWRYVAVALAAVIILLCFGGYYIYTRRRRALLYNKYVANINRLKMQNIRNCISPHFTFNVLNHEIELNAASAGKHDRLVELAQLLRKSLDSSGQIAVPLSAELDFIQSYVRLLNECGKSFTYRMQVDDGIDTASVLIPSMIVQIPVENAVKHGFLHDDPAHYIHIDVKSGNGGVDIEIRNNGVSYSPFARVDKARGCGIGMQVIFQSLLMLNMKNADKITFTITGRKDEGEFGTLVRIHIPYKFDYSVFTG